MGCALGGLECQVATNAEGSVELFCFVLVVVVCVIEKGHVQNGSTRVDCHRTHCTRSSNCTGILKRYIFQVNMR